MTKIFEVGDKVRCHKWSGVAEIIHISGIDDMCYDDYVITVKSESGTKFHFTIDGKLDRNDVEATLRHVKTGKAALVGEPPERFEYPLYRGSKIPGIVVEFTDLTAGTVLVCGTSDYHVGETFTNFLPHTDAWWVPCEKPKWVPTKPTWCWVWDGNEMPQVLRLIIEVVGTEYSDASNVCWPNAEPCKESELPTHWPKEWI